MAKELQVLIEESGLEKSKAQYMLDRFTDDFQVAAEWESKVKDIVVTDASQTGIMKMARAGRLFLRDRRIKVETARKHLKEQSLREGKAIDGIANVLKALIVPVEEHLYRQEHFVEIQLKAEAEQKRIEIVQQVERDRLAQEKAEAKEQERIRLENVKLREMALADIKRLRREKVKREKAEQAKKVAEAKAATAKAAIAEAERAKQGAEIRAKAAEAEAIEAEKKRKEAEKQQAQAKIDMEQKLAAAEIECKEMEAVAERLRIHETQKAEQHKKQVLIDQEENKKALLALGDDGQIAENPQVVCPFCNGKFYLSESGATQL